MTLPPVPWILSCVLDEVSPVLVWFTISAADGTVVLSDCRELGWKVVFERILACVNACHDLSLSELEMVAEMRLGRSKMFSRMVGWKRTVRRGKRKKKAKRLDKPTHPE